MSANHIASKKLLGMPANSVAGIFIFTIIAFSFFNHGFCTMSHNPVSSKNMTTLQLTQNISTTISEMTSMIHNNLSNNQPVNSSRVSLQVQENFQLMSDYLEALNKNLELVSVHQMVTKKLETARSRVLELENHQNDLKIQLADEKKNQYNIIKENNNLASKLHESEEKISNITEDNLKLSNEYTEMEKSYSTNQEKTKLINDELGKEKENYKTLFDAKTLVDNKLSQLNDTLNKVSLDQNKTLAEYSKVNKKYNESSGNLIYCENNVKTLTDQIVDLKKKLEMEKFNSIENEQTQSKIIAFKSNELEVLNQTHLNMKLQLKNEIDLLKNTNEKLIQESNALKEINEKNLKVIENCLTNKQTNKYFCNKKTTYYDSKICALLSQNADGSEIFMDWKKLTFLPRDIFTGLEKVKALVLHNNHLTNLEPGVFDGLFGCGILNLSNNDLTTLSKDTFTSLKQLYGLWLHSNQLNKLESGTFDGLFSLETLNLSQNQLTYLPQDIFKDNHKLKFLYLDHNQINTLSSETFSKLLLTDLMIHGNRLDDSNIEILKKNIFVKHQFLY